MTDILSIVELRDEWGAFKPEFMREVAEALNTQDNKAARVLTRDLHAADLADLIEVLEPNDRVKLITILGRSFDAEALPELDEAVRAGIYAINVDSIYEIGLVEEAKCRVVAR